MSCSSRRFDILRVIHVESLYIVSVYIVVSDHIIRILFVFEFRACLLFRTFTLLLGIQVDSKKYILQIVLIIWLNYWKFDVWDNSGNWDELYSVMSIEILLLAWKMIPYLILSRDLTSSKFCFLICL